MLEINMIRVKFSHNLDTLFVKIQLYFLWMNICLLLYILDASPKQGVGSLGNCSYIYDTGSTHNASTGEV